MLSDTAVEQAAAPLDKRTALVIGLDQTKNPGGHVHSIKLP